VETIPVTSYVTIENNARTVEQGTDDSITISRAWRSRSNTIQVEGTFAAGKSPREGTLSLWQPENYFLTLLAEKLEHYGVRASLSGFDTVRSGRQPLVTITHRLDSVVIYMNKQSDNLSAENLFKTLGANFLDPPGSAAKGTEVIKRFLSVSTVDTSRIVVADGSGVSRYDLISADGLIKVLMRMAGDSQAFPAFNASLPIAGVDGTLSKRMKNSPAAGNLRGKTGSLTGVSSLSGYARTAEGELLAFSILMQNFVANSSRYREVQDRIGSLMCSLRRETF
jgi:D-alanyl-D-alanine carboxypeptidase/D-alanyl-D-alanine-endopeptidase (penicillin-binding protein 4)